MKSTKTKVILSVIIIIVVVIFASFLLLRPKFDPWYSNSWVEFNYSHYGGDWPYEQHLAVCTNGRLVYTTDGRWTTKKLTASEFNELKNEYKESTTKTMSKDFRDTKELSKFMESIQTEDLVDKKQKVDGLNFDYTTLCTN